jgi:hypothetical protein
MNDKNGTRYAVGNRFFTGNSRSTKRAMKILGVNQNDSIKSQKKHYRSEKLRVVEKYLEGHQYDGKMDWDTAAQSKDPFIPIRDRKPRVIFPFAKVLQDRLASKLVGKSTFPKFRIEDDEEADYFMGLVKDHSFFAAKMLDIAKDFISYTSVFARFKIIHGSLKIESHNANYCYPELGPDGELESVEIKYVYETDETDEQGKQIKKWYRALLGKETDILFDNPIFEENKQPEFEEQERVDHGLGFVQGEWFRYGETTYDVDGNDYPLAYQLSGFIDAINYNLSQSDQAASYGMEPQLVLNGITQDQAEELIKSSTRGWILGKEGTASFIETSGSGIQRGKEVRDDQIKLAADCARVVFLDPEKMVGNAQSAKAMEVMHGPLVEMINEMRPWFEKSMIKLMQKLISVLAIYNSQGMELALTMPPKWMPSSLDIKIKWPPVFELTTQDKQQIVAVAIQAASGNIISRATALKWVQEQGVDFGVDDIEMETQIINGQQQFNSFF